TLERCKNLLLNPFRSFTSSPMDTHSSHMNAAGRSRSSQSQSPSHSASASATSSIHKRKLASSEDHAPTLPPVLLLRRHSRRSSYLQRRPRKHQRPWRRCGLRLR
ncbi:hypothetical protein Ancab_020170, partial [Ancistrocladus abbreviatus]